ncbi:hypothetical protein [Brevundimonas sp.]|uniref:hypothetical protein n=1 Tax=Brevundimonas sp. TaxID=1871086 RepID=UPI002D6CFB66|nr:hypothetical protein [Brevundimonas sp.]HYC66677.1 hypothetical protein [Brevundimonas sp.]
MRMHPNARIATTFAAALAVCATPRPTEESKKRDTPAPPEPKPEPAPTNLPGETNRQFAARLKAARKPSEQAQ